jgi:hypothetical protein
MQDVTLLQVLLLLNQQLARVVLLPQWANQPVQKCCCNGLPSQQPVAAVIDYHASK